jgi:hypothetical protein
MADASAQPKPSSSVKLVLLGEAAVGKVSASVLGANMRKTDRVVVIACDALRQQ